MGEVVLESSDLIVSEADSQGNITFANDTFFKVSGYSKKEVIGSTHAILKHEDIPVVVYEELWRTLTEGKIWRGVLKNRTKDGRFFWVTSTISPVTHPNGNAGYLAVRKRATPKDIERHYTRYGVLEKS